MGFVDRGSTSGHNVMFFTWNDARKKIAAFTVELRVCIITSNDIMCVLLSASALL